LRLTRALAVGPKEIVLGRLGGGVVGLGIDGEAKKQGAKKPGQWRKIRRRLWPRTAGRGDAAAMLPHVSERETVRRWLHQRGEAVPEGTGLRLCCRPRGQVMTKPDQLLRKVGKACTLIGRDSAGRVVMQVVLDDADAAR